MLFTMEKYTENHHAVQYLKQHGPAICIFYSTKEETGHNGSDLEKLFGVAKNVLSEEDYEMAKLAFLGYLYALTMTDNFANDKKRDAYENKLAQKYPTAYEVMKTNRLALKNILNVMNMFYYLRDKYKFLQKPEFEEKIQAVKKRFFPRSKWTKLTIGETNYDMLCDADKIILSDRIARFAKDVCLAIALK